MAVGRNFILRSEGSEQKPSDQQSEITAEPTTAASPILEKRRVIDFIVEYAEALEEERERRKMMPKRKSEVTAHGRDLEAAIRISGELDASLRQAINRAVDGLGGLDDAARQASDAASRLSNTMDSQRDALERHNGSMLLMCLVESEDHDRRVSWLTKFANCLLI